jgi:hypothetical protein
MGASRTPPIFFFSFSVSLSSPHPPPPKKIPSYFTLKITQKFLMKKLLGGRENNKALEHSLCSSPLGKKILNEKLLEKTPIINTFKKS